MPAELTGRVALVTGSATGIGRAIAEALAARGAAVVAHGLVPKQVAATVADWRARAWQTLASTVDLAAGDGAATLFAETTATLGAPDILVLNASIELPEELPNLTMAAMQAQLAVNLTASCQLLQVCVPEMTKRGWGRVVAIGSVQEDRPNARHLFYAATKASLTSVVLNLARNHCEPGITFNVVRPGAIATDRNRVVIENAAQRAAVIARIPLRRIGQPKDCAAMVSLLCSDEASYINGAVIAIDGGMRL